MSTEVQGRTGDLIAPHGEVWPEALDLPCQLCVALEVPHFTIRELISLDVNSLVDTRRREGAHVPVMVNGVMVAWAEFDVLDGQLAVRMTEML